MKGMRPVNMKKKIGLLFLVIIFVLGACGANDEKPMNNDGEKDVVGNEENQSDANDGTDNIEENDTEESFTISSMEETPFEEIDGKTAVKMYTEDWSDPYDLQELRFKMYYGDEEFITAAPDKGIFRYDLKEDQVIWENDLTVASSEMYDGFLYGTQMEESSNYASIGVLDLENGTVEKMYEEKDRSIAHRIQMIDDLMFFTTPPIDKDADYDSDLIAYDLNTDTILWTTPVVGISDQRPLDLGDNILLFNNYENRAEGMMAEDIAYIYDKETGEEKFNIVADAIQRDPSINDEGIYFADFRENKIRLYDFDGNLKNEIEPEIGFSLYQLIRPIATEEAFIYADNEGIIWYEPDLSTIQHRVELGESTIRYMEATDDRIFAIISEKTDEDEDLFFNISLDVKTGEVYEKVAIETQDNSTVRARHVYNNKFHYAVVDVEASKEVYYVFSGEDVNKPIIE